MTSRTTPWRKQKSAPAGDTVAESWHRPKPPRPAGEAAEAARGRCGEAQGQGQPKRTRRAKPKAGEEPVRLRAARRKTEKATRTNGRGGRYRFDLRGYRRASSSVTTTMTTTITTAKRKSSNPSGAEDAMEEVADRHIRKPRKQYRIQEVIKRRQILPGSGRKGRARQTRVRHSRPIFRSQAATPFSCRTRRAAAVFRARSQPAGPQASEGNRRGLDVPQGMGVICAPRSQSHESRDQARLRIPHACGENVAR